MNAYNMPIDDLTDQVIGLAYDVHNELGAGFLESVYEGALLYELAQSKIPASSQIVTPVYYKGNMLARFSLDILVADRLILELKAVEKIHIAHEVQLVNYLAATKIDDGLVLNFGDSVTVRRKFRKKRSYRR